LLSQVDDEIGEYYDIMSDGTQSDLSKNSMKALELVSEKLDEFKS